MWTETFYTTADELLQAFARTEFYVELSAIGVCIALALGLSWVLHRFARRNIAFVERFAISQEALLKPLVLLAPLLAVLLLSSARPVVENFTETLMILPEAINLAMAYLAVRFVLLVVKTRPVAWFISTVVLVYATLAASGFMAITAEYLGNMGFSLGKYKLTMLGVIQGFVIFVIVFWLAGAATRTLDSYLRRVSALSYSARELIKKFFTVFVYFIAFVITLGAMGVDLTALAVFGGALGVGIGLGLQKVTANFVSGITILLEKSIKIGDLIEVGVNTGHVRQLHMRYALLETFDGREVLIPNEELVSQKVTNWTYSNEYARVDIRVVVAYESDSKLAQELMLAAAKAHPLCKKKPAPECWLREFADHGLVFLLTFWIPDVQEGRNTPQSQVMFKILESFKQNGIEIPYPRQLHLERKA